MQNEINELRNQVRTLRRMLFGVFGVVVVGGLLAATSLQSVPDLIRAKTFWVLNDEGAPIITMQGAENGGITFRDKDGKVTVRIGGGNGSMSIYNKDRKYGAAIYANADGGALRIANKEGKAVVVISADADGNGAIKIFDSKGELTSQSP